jgi:transcriptional regulator with XRE-family HTH domain
MAKLILEVDWDKAERRRKALGLTQEEVAVRMGFNDQSGLAHLKSGRNRIKVIQLGELADILRVSPRNLLSIRRERVEAVNQ